jgi:hypothetical protein
MKPLFSIATFVLLVGACQLAGAQTPSVDIPDASGRSYPWPTPVQPWEMNPPLAELPHGYLWQDYTGGGKHGPYGARGHVAIRPVAPARSLIAVVCCWLDQLVAGRCRTSAQEPCVPYAPSRSELPAPQHEPAGAPFAFPIPIPSRPPSAVRTAPQESVADSPAQPAPGSKPTIIGDPAPLNPIESEVPRSENSGVVELAPDFVFPKEKATPTAPRNRIPARDDLPRNSIPAQ